MKIHLKRANARVKQLQMQMEVIEAKNRELKNNIIAMEFDQTVMSERDDNNPDKILTMKNKKTYSLPVRKVIYQFILSQVPVPNVGSLIRHSMKVLGH